MLQTKLLVIHFVEFQVEFTLQYPMNMHDYADTKTKTSYISTQEQFGPLDLDTTNSVMVTNYRSLHKPVWKPQWKRPYILILVQPKPLKLQHTHQTMCHNVLPYKAMRNVTNCNTHLFTWPEQPVRN